MPKYGCARCPSAPWQSDWGNGLLTLPVMCFSAAPSSPAPSVPFGSDESGWRFGGYQGQSGKGHADRHSLFYFPLWAGSRG
jgi:hypothetical protein